MPASPPNPSPRPTASDAAPPADLPGGALPGERPASAEEAKFRGLFNAMAEGMALHELLCAPDGRPVDYVVLEVNPAYERHTGLTHAQVVGRRATEVYGTATPPYLDLYAQVATTGQPARFETYFTPLQRHFQVSVFRPQPGQFATVFEDITERKRADAALRESEARFRTLVEHAQDAVFVQVESRFAYANPAALALFGARSSAELVGQPIRERFAPEFHEQIRARIHRINVLKLPVPMLEQVCLRLDGTPVPVETSAAPIEYEGQPGAVVYARDITLRKAAEQSRTRLVAELDHRVKNNLAAVLALAQQAAGHCPDNATFLRVFTGRLRALATGHELLASGKWGDFEVGAALARLVAAFAPQGERFLAAGPPMRLPARQATPLCLTLHELATNATKHGAWSGAGGRVEVMWRQAPDGWLELAWTERGGPPLPAAAPPRGTGLELVTGLIEYEAAGKVHYHFAPEGFHCTIRLNPG